MSREIYKYPRTRHIQGSRSQPGDEDLDIVSFSNISNKFVVVEEKVDGANCGISLSDSGKILIQSRGHYLTGSPREVHFDLLKMWVNVYLPSLRELIGNRYIMYGEWLYAKHTVFYNSLSHYFLEFDIYDKANEQFLDTESRIAMLKKYTFIQSVPILYKGKLKKYAELTSLIGKSHFISDNNVDELSNVCKKRNLNFNQVLKESDTSNIMEGIYIKVEEAGIVKARYKYVRKSFLTNITDSETHWLDRSIVPNVLRPEIDLFVTKKGDSDGR